MNSKNLLFTLILTLFSLVFIFLADLIFSNTVLKYHNCIKFEPHYYELKKNCISKYRFKNRFPITKIITDELGQRIGKNSLPKDKNKKNIFLFGDSFTYGVGLNYENTYAGLIANKKKDYNIYNFAVGSYSPSVYLYKLKEFINNKIFPDKIIVFLDLTDVFDEAKRWNYNESLEKLELNSTFAYEESLKKEKFFKRNFKILTNISSYLNFYSRNLRDKINIKFRNQQKIKTSIQGSFTYTNLKSLNKTFWDENSFDKGVNLIEERLKQISIISKKYNSEFYLVVYPWAETLELGQNIFSWSKFAKNICDKENCTLIDTIPSFSKYKEKNKTWSSDLYFLNDEHFNKKGAKILFEDVIKIID